MLSQLIAMHGYWAFLLPCSMQGLPSCRVLCMLQISIGVV